MLSSVHEYLIIDMIFHSNHQLFVFCGFRVLEWRREMYWIFFGNRSRSPESNLFHLFWWRFFDDCHSLRQSQLYAALHWTQTTMISFHPLLFLSSPLISHLILFCEPLSRCDLVTYRLSFFYWGFYLFLLYPCLGVILLILHSIWNVWLNEDTSPNRTPSWIWLGLHIPNIWYNGDIWCKFSYDSKKHRLNHWISKWLLWLITENMLISHFKMVSLW